MISVARIARAIATLSSLSYALFPFLKQSSRSCFCKVFRIKNLQKARTALLGFRTFESLEFSQTNSNQNVNTRKLILLNFMKIKSAIVSVCCSLCRNMLRDYSEPLPRFRLAFSSAEIILYSKINLPPPSVIFPKEIR